MFVLFVRLFGHQQSTLNVSFVTLTDVDHPNHKENNRAVKTDSTLVQFPPIVPVPRNPLARESLMASTFFDGNQDPLLLSLADDGLSSPVRPFRHSVWHTPELSPTASASGTTSRSPPENDFSHQGNTTRDAQRPPTGTDRGTSLSPGDALTDLHKTRFSVEPIRENADANDSSRADGVYHYEDSAEVGLEGNLEMEIDGLLEELMDYHSKRRVTMSFAPLLPLPEDFSPVSSPQMHSDSAPSPLVTTSMLFSGDSDTPSLTPSSPKSPKGSYFSPTRSPSLKSKRGSTPITPSTDGWRSPPSLATVPERKSPTPGSFGYARLSGHSEVWPPDPPGFAEDAALDINTSNETHHGNLPPVRTTIPEDSSIRRRTKNSISPQNTITDDHRSHVESPVDRPASSHISDGDASELTEMGYTNSGFDHLYPSNSSPVSIRFAQPNFGDEPHESGGYLPTSSISPGFVDYPSPSDPRYASSNKRGMFQSLFSSNNPSEQKKERKRSKGRDSVETQPPAPRSIDTISFSTASSKSSKDKEKKKAKAERREELAARLKAKQLRQDAEKDRRTPSSVTASRKAAAAWEERGAMYSMDGMF